MDFQQPFHVGFTGTRNGMTPEQAARVQLGLERIVTLHGSETVVHHGDCVGADAEFHAIATDLGCYHIGHPGDYAALRANCEFDECHKPKPLLERNRDIVDACEVLITAPATAEEVQRSGAWATIRYARRKGKKIRIVNPDGTVS